MMARKYSDEQLMKAFKCIRDNKKEIEQSGKCGCFTCLTIFYPYEIEKWIPDESGSAVCPYCHEDTVIGDVFGHPITKEFLEEMGDFYFRGFKDRNRYKEFWGLHCWIEYY